MGARRLAWAGLAVGVALLSWPASGAEKLGAKASATIGGGGAKVAIPKRAEASIPEGSLPPGVVASLGIKASGPHEGFGTGPDDMVDPACVVKFLPFDIEFAVSGSTPPALDTEITLAIPKGSRPAPEAQELTAFFRWSFTNELESHAGYNLIPSTFNAVAGTLSASLPSGSEPFSFSEMPARIVATLTFALVKKRCPEPDTGSRVVPLFR